MYPESKSALDVRGFRFVVLGDGVFGSLAAVALSRMGPTVLYGAGKLPPSAIESVPAVGLASLAEWGVRVCPRVLSRRRAACWESATPGAHFGSACCHVDRRELLASVWRRLDASGVERRRVDGGLGRADAAALQAQGGTVVDATGRRALSAKKVRRFGSVAVVWTFPDAARPDLSLEMFDDGYAYRLGDGVVTTLGFCGQPRSRTERARLLSRLRTHWIGAGLSRTPSASCTRLCGPQWPEIPESRALLRVGDAAAARDPLSSLGLAVGLADLWAALSVARYPADRPLLAALRQRQRLAHLMSLSGFIERGRFHEAPYWRAYRGWLSRNLATFHARNLPTVALQGDRLVAVDRLPNAPQTAAPPTLTRKPWRMPRAPDGRG